MEWIPSLQCDLQMAFVFIFVVYSERKMEMLDCIKALYSVDLHIYSLIINLEIFEKPDLSLWAPFLRYVTLNFKFDEIS